MHEPDWQRPPPPGARAVRGNPLVRALLLGGIALVLLLAAIFVPIPIFFSYLPGPIRNVERLVEVDGRQTYSSEGELMLTTVSVDANVTALDMLRAGFDDAVAVVFEQDVTQGRSIEELIESQREEMRLSKQHAQEVALSALGLAEPTGEGARVDETMRNFPAAEVLEKGDVIVGVDGTQVDTTCDVGRAIDRHEPGEEVRVTVERDGRSETFTLETVENPQEAGAPIIGVLMSDVGYEFEPGVDVEIETGRIGGPSGGLMMTLAIYDRLTPEDLTSGKKIAGTGTIACDGGVGPIGGIEQKVAAAEAKGADLFLSPVANFDAAERIADEMPVVAISTFDDAVQELEDLE